MPDSIFTSPDWAKSHLGNSIALYHSHPVNALASLKPLLFIGGIHGDEPEGVFLAEELLGALRQRPGKVAWALITCMNPDGYLARQRCNGRMVDLNRNFPTPDWQESEEGTRYYSGPAPASENESQALVQLIAQIQPSCILHFHSWKPCVVYTGPAGEGIARALSSAQHPAREDIGYPTPGSLGQYGWLCHQTPVICIEEREGASREQVWYNFGEKLLSLTDSEQGSDAYKPQIKAIAFDLDDTLLDTSRYLVPLAQQEAFQAMRDAGLDASLPEMEDLKKLHFKNPSSEKDLFEFICDAFSLSDQAKQNCINAARQSFYIREIPADIRLFDGVSEMLAQLKATYSLYLVTSGDPVTQLKKVAALGLDEAFIAHFCVDSLAGERKRDSFEKILERENLSPEQLLCVGNRIDNEIEEANLLNCKTCLVRHGEYVHLAPLNPEQKPDYEVERIVDLISACHL